MTEYILFAVVALSAAALGVPFLQYAGRRGNLPGYLLLLALAVALASTVLNAATGSTSTAPFGSLLASDSLGNLFAILTLFVTLFVAAASLTLVPSGRSSNSPFYYSLLSFAALGMLLISYSADLLMLFVSWELMSIPTYALAGFKKDREESNEAAVKYAVLGALSSAVILYAISLTYGLTGTTNIAAAVASLGSQLTDPIAGLVVLLFIVGFGFKMSIVPFHMWAPDAYEGAPTPIATLFAAGTKKAGFVAAIRVVLAISTVYSLTPQGGLFTIPNILAVLALATMTLGNLAALTQKSVTRLLAYSSIAQAGYILVGFVIYSYGQGNPAFAQQAVLGLTGALFHIINHSVMKGLAFLGAGLVILKLGSGSVEAFDGLGKRMPVTAFAMAISFLALAGIPPLSGFWSKLLLFTSVLNTPYAWLAVAGLLNSALSMGYYGWLIKRMYLDDPDGEATRVLEPTSFVMVLGVLVALIIAFGLFPGPVISFARDAVPSLGGP
ncbi:MAG TPA: NADH-quinone oxidoreductase subunit N [Nitrososphaerales archaeon]|nr:NADH-quinone oxidoreductase subunit N [Nitrososphaerales archaeon]